MSSSIKVMVTLSNNYRRQADMRTEDQAMRWLWDTVKHNTESSNTSEVRVMLWMDRDESS